MYVSYEKLLNGVFRKIIFSSTHNCLSPRISRVVNTQLTGIASIPKSQANYREGRLC